MTLICRFCNWADGPRFWASSPWQPDRARRFRFRIATRGHYKRPFSFYPASGELTGVRCGSKKKKNACAILQGAGSTGKMVVMDLDDILPALNEQEDRCHGPWARGITEKAQKERWAWTDPIPHRRQASCLLHPHKSRIRRRGAERPHSFGTQAGTSNAGNT